MNSKKKISKTHFTDKANRLSDECIKAIKKHVVKFGEPNIWIAEDSDGDIMFDINRFIVGCTPTHFQDNMNEQRDYEELNPEQLAILADYITNL